MKQLTILVVLIAVMSVNLAFRKGLYNPAEASRGPERSARQDRAIGVDRAAQIDRPAGKPQGPMAAAAAIGSRTAADLALETAREGDVVLARVAAECGNVLFDRIRHSPDNPHLLKQTAQHYRACLEHEPTTRDAGPLFRKARNRLEQVERLLANLDAGKSNVPQAKPEADSAPTAKPAEEPKAPVEKPSVEKGESTMVGPDGVIYKRSKKP